MRAPRPTASRQARARSSASRRPASSSGTATFSSAVIVAIRWKDWKTMPTRSRRSMASSSSVMVPRSRPATETRPSVARSSPAATSRVEVLPDPDGPTTATDSPGATARSMPRRTLTGPAALTRVRWTSSSSTAQSEPAMRARSLFRPILPDAYGPAAAPFNAPDAALAGNHANGRSESSSRSAT